MRLKHIKLFEDYSEEVYDRILDIYNEKGLSDMTPEEIDYLKSGGNTKIPSYRAAGLKPNKDTRELIPDDVFERIRKRYPSLNITHNDAENQYNLLKKITGNSLFENPREYAKKIEIFSTDVYKVPGLNNQEIEILMDQAYKDGDKERFEYLKNYIK